MAEVDGQRTQEIEPVFDRSQTIGGDTTSCENDGCLCARRADMDEVV